MLKEFKEFVLKGNMLDMAVGIIIGGAFGTIISSLVKDIIMPPIGLMMGGVDFAERSQWEWTEGSAVTRRRCSCIWSSGGTSPAPIASATP